MLQRSLQNWFRRWFPTLACLAGFGVAAWKQRWIGDDGLIYIRVVQQILAGNGPNFNVGERVEAATGPLWTWLLAGFGALGFSPAPTSVYLGIAMSMLGLALASVASARLHGSLRTPLPVGLIAYAALPPAWDYASSGLETGLSLLYVGSMHWAAAAHVERPHDRERLVGLAVLAGLGPLVRPELSLYAGPVLLYAAVVSWRETRSWKQVALLATLGCLSSIVYEIFRMGYYASLTPNTAVAKMAFGAYWEQGQWFAHDFFVRYWLWVPGVTVAAFWVPLIWEKQPSAGSPQQAFGRRFFNILPMVVGFVLAVHTARIGGDFMHGRMWLLPISLMVLPVFVVSPRAPWMSVRGVSWVAMVLWAGATIAWLRPDVENFHFIGDERGWYVRGAGVANPTTVEDYRNFPFYVDIRATEQRTAAGCPDPTQLPRGQALVFLDAPEFGSIHPERLCVPLDSSTVAPGTRLVLQRGAIGIMGTALEDRPIHLADHHGLAEPIGARLIPYHRGRPGHERALDTFWLAARFSTPFSDEDPWVTAGRRALRCGAPARLLRSITGPMTFQRFVTNIGQSLDNHRLAIPANPFDAERLFCAEGTVD